MKKIVISIIVVILISVGIVSCLYINNKNKKDEIKQNETSNKVIKNIDVEEEEKENEPISEDIKNDNDDNKNISNNDDNTNKSNMEINSSSNSNVIKENKTQVQEKEEKHNDNNKVVQQPQVQPEKPVVKEEPKQQTEWEKLGISEYDYYNKPMWSWARIDYSIKDYGSFEQTHQACIDAGNKLEDILSFSCTNINSYSGAYLGDMLKVKY